MTEWWQELFLSGCYTELEDIPPERTEAEVEFVVRALGLKPGARLLDVACGIGRHSLPLAARGIEVVGLDYTPAYLKQALGGASGLPAHFVRGDMRRLPLREGRFDAAINLFTAFGYFEEEADDAATLREIGWALRPGGQFLIDTLHRDGLVRRFLPRDWHIKPDSLLLEERVWNARAGRVESTWTFLRGGRVRSFRLSNRVYTCSEIERMLAAAGMQVADVWGDWDGGGLEMGSHRLLVKARKA